ncbi:MAG TPA: glutamate--tRNA ligase family protein [Candidatus Saccharimonadales bacterium]|nr:glutamate--tRNA ligase family protein [Candidatus Saccharimonadales bacterium]
MSQVILSTETLDRILPTGERTIEEIEATYPPRNLPAGAEVVRVAPSPTGFMHIGTLYMAFICKRLAAQTGGIYYLRIEDTDTKREVEGARELIIEMLENFDLAYDEGPIIGGELGGYGPYSQTKRADIYKTYVRKLLERGLAYPCFATPEELEANAKNQMAQKIRPGYYGEWAVWRDKPESEVVKALDAGKQFVIRFRSTGDVNKRRVVHDLIKGRKELPENDNDIVVLKRIGLPTYHLAHAVDDFLMGTTTILRTDEWFPSTTLHMQLTEALGHKPFVYAHGAPIQKMDGNSRRKLSKRKDPEANVAFFEQEGYPVVAVLEYLLNLANSNFEDWRRANPNLAYKEFEFKLDKMQKNSGALLSMEKLEDISRNYLASLTAKQVFDLVVKWSQKYDQELEVALLADPEYSAKVLSIERDNAKRKDIGKMSDFRDAYGFFFDDIFAQVTEFDFGGVAPADAKALIADFLASYDPADDQQTWFEKLKTVGSKNGFTPDTREFRQNPDKFKGSVAEVAMVLRVALTGRNRSPNLHEMMLVMGKDRVVERFNRI